MILEILCNGECLDSTQNFLLMWIKIWLGKRHDVMMVAVLMMMTYTSYVCEFFWQ